jgi:hypothetical protein
MSDVLDFLDKLVWLDGSPLLGTIEPYRREIFEQAFSADDAGRPRYSPVLTGRGKKNAKSLDLILAALFSLLQDDPRDCQCYLLANDEGQAADDLVLAKKLIASNPVLRETMRIKLKTVERNDGKGFLEILPAGDLSGHHGKTYRFCGWDEIHGHKTWAALEGMQPDPSRPEALQWITSYASLYSRPGAPLHDLLQAGQAGRDRRMLFSWYAADYCTDVAFAQLTDPLDRANPSRASFEEGYLEQQRERLPSHLFRRLHLNLGGQPEGSAYAAEPIDEAIVRGLRVRHPEPGIQYVAACDMSGGSSDDSVLAIAHAENDTRVLDALVSTEQWSKPFDPAEAIKLFAHTLKLYRCTTVYTDQYGSQMYRQRWLEHGITAIPSKKSASEYYQAFEPVLNAGTVQLLDRPMLESQLLGLAWKGTKIDHQSGEHDDAANAVVMALVECVRPKSITMFLLDRV